MKGLDSVHRQVRGRGSQQPNALAFSAQPHLPGRCLLRHEETVGGGDVLSTLMQEGENIPQLGERQA